MIRGEGEVEEEDAGAGVGQKSKNVEFLVGGVCCGWTVDLVVSS